MIVIVNAMSKQIVVEVPDWVDEEFVTQILKKLIEIEETRKKTIEKVIRKLELMEKDLEDFERFRDELWEKEAENYFSL